MATIHVRKPTETGLLDSARGLSPQIAAASDQIERDRRLPRWLVDSMVAAGLFRMLVPDSLGGPECDLITFSRVIEEVARADGSTAWCLGQGAGSGHAASYMDRQAAREIFGDPKTVVAWGPGAGTARTLDGGYLLSGEWPFASGSHHASWMGGTARIANPDGSPHLLENGRQEVRRLLFPASVVEFSDVWRVSGLRGTGSDTYSVTNLYVPVARSLPALPSGLPLQDHRTEPGPLYAFPLVLVYAVAFASVALGIARGALEAFVELAREKPQRGAEGALRDDGLIQSQVGRSEAGVRSARAFLHTAIREGWEVAPPTGTIPLAQRAEVRLAATHAIHASAQAVDTVYHGAGATAIFETNPFERRWRDIHAVMQQGQGSQTHFKTVGQFLLGLEPDPGGSNIGLAQL